MAARDQRSVVEIGPDRDPICADCHYLGTENQFKLLTRQWWNFRKADIKRTGLRPETVDVFFSVNFPWFRAANLQHDYDSTIGQLQFVSGSRQPKLNKDFIETIVAEDEAFIREGLEEVHRVLKPGGEIFVLYSERSSEGWRSYKREPLHYLSGMVKISEEIGFNVRSVVPAVVTFRSGDRTINGLILKRL